MQVAHWQPRLQSPPGGRRRPTGAARMMLGPGHWPPPQRPKTESVTVARRGPGAGHSGKVDSARAGTRSCQWPAGGRPLAP
jgi:hypothetical protein